MARLRIRAQARRDLEQVLEAGSIEFGPEVAERHHHGFERLFGLLRHTPHAGQARPELGDGVRSLSHRPHRVLYRVTGESVIILRVLHHARDVRAMQFDQ